MIISFFAQIDLDLTTGNSFKLAPVSFWSAFIIFWALLYFLASQDIPGYLIFSLPLSWNQSLLYGNLASFFLGWYLETKIWVLGIEQGFLTEDQWTSTMCGLQDICESLPIVCRILCVCFHVSVSWGLESDFQMRVLDLKEVKNSWLRVYELFQCI